MPTSFDLPGNYDEEGQPIEEEVKETWRERREYVDMVRSAEQGDSMLSECFASKRCQTLAYTYGAYTSIGKIGFYSRVIEELESESEKPCERSS